jgi:rubrerythrin
MPLRQLKNMYEKRKNTLTDLLHKDTRLDRSRKDQIMGAIAEIDTLLKAIDKLRDQEIEDNRRLEILSLDIKKLNPLNIPVIKKISDKIKIKFEQSKTKHNLMHLFIRKCETTTKYALFAKYAKQEGYEHVSKLFSEFSDQEREHAKAIHKFLNLDRSTPENIKESAGMEQLFHNKLYIEYEETAKHESFSEIAEFFKELSDIEAEHEKTMLKLLKNFHDKRLFKHDQTVRWKCKNCGYIIESKEAPRKCKICHATQGHFSVVHEN